MKKHIFAYFFFKIFIFERLLTSAEDDSFENVRHSSEKSILRDSTGFVSVAFRNSTWEVIPKLIDWDEDHSIKARANFTNLQNSTG